MYRVLCVLALFLAASCDQIAVAPDDLLTGRVVGVADGDTFTLLLAGSRQMRVRLDQIDAPERAQAWSTRSREMLSDLLDAGPVSVRIEDTDRYGRSVARVYAGDVDVNMAMVEQGGAWAYRQYMRDPAFLRAEAKARREKRGLWSMPERDTVAPWEFRRERLAQRETIQTSVPLAAALPSTDSEPSCGAKSQCRQMTSCEEATHYLRTCGIRRLDGDGDGMPCEAICRGGGVGRTNPDSIAATAG